MKYVCPRIGKKVSGWIRIHRPTQREPKELDYLGAAVDSLGMRKNAIVLDPMPEDVKAALRKMLEDYGVEQACNLLHLSRSAVTQALAGMRVRRSTTTQVRVVLRQIAVGEVKPPSKIEPAPQVTAFVEERCVVHPGGSVDSEALYAAWSGWCEQHGRMPCTVGVFGRMLFEAFPHLRVSRPRAGAKRLRVYEGIRLKP